MAAAVPGSSAGESVAPARSARPAPAMLDRVAPHNLDAEEGVLASIMLDGGREVMTLCEEAKIKPEAFYKPAHQLIFQTLQELSSLGSSFDEITVADRLKSTDRLEEIGGYASLTRIANRIETSAHARHWLDIVREKWFLRRVIGTSTKIIEDCYGGQEDLDAQLEKFEQEFFAISQDRVTESAQPLSKSVDEASNLIARMLQQRGQLSGVSTGFIDLDRMTFGLHPQEMIVLAARPSMGKTSLALNVAEGAAMPVKEGLAPVPTLVFSLEMGADQLAMRMLCGRAKVNLKKVREGFVNEHEQRALGKAAAELKKAPLWIDDSGHLTILEMRAKARRMHSKQNLGLIIIDYLQLLAGTDPRVPREQQIAEISRGIKAMAKELGLPVIVLSQLNRESEKEKRDPRLSDLRESGSIEQDADVVLLLAKGRDADDNASVQAGTGRRELIIAKQRNGPVGSIPLTFVPDYTRFENFTSQAAS